MTLTRYKSDPPGGAEREHGFRFSSPGVVCAVAALSAVALRGLMVAGFIFFLAPFYFLWQALFVVAAYTGWTQLIAFQVTVIMGMRWLIYRHFKESAVSGLLHPLGFSFLFLACFCATLRRLAGASVHWKKRLYGGKSGVE